MKPPIIIVTCAAVLLSACEPSKTADSGDALKSSGKDGTTLEATSPAPTSLPMNASRKELIETLRKRRADHLKTEPFVTPTPSPATGE